MQTNRARLFGCLDRIVSGADEYILSLSKEIDAAERIFVMGMGRSGLIGKMFAIRLCHLGKACYAVWDACTPPIRKGDLLLAISGSGTTSSVMNVIRKASEESADVMLVSSNPDALTDLPSAKLMFLDVTKAQCDRSIFPMGTIFELSAIVCLDLVIADIIDRKNIDAHLLRERHANLE